MGEEFRVLDEAQIGAALDALARRVRAGFAEPPLLVGIRRRGVPLAQALAARLGDPGRPPPVQELTLQRYADDLRLLHERPTLEAPEGFDVRGGTVLLVDDVLFSGRTLLRAAQHALDAGARRVRVAVLCERAGLEAPVAAALVGHRLDAAPGTKVEVRVPPYEDEWGVYLVRVPR